MVDMSRQVLVVEDDDRLMTLVQRWLVDAGHDVIPCTNFETARAYLASHTPDVVVSDVRLGAFNGLQLVLVAKDANPAVVAIVMSGFTDPVLRAEAQRAGASYIPKPLNREDLLELVGGVPHGTKH
jgi:DNA-binding NtrC family response regulator